LAGGGARLEKGDRGRGASAIRFGIPEGDPPAENGGDAGAASFPTSVEREVAVAQRMRAKTSATRWRFMAEEAGGRTRRVRVRARQRRKSGNGEGGRRRRKAAAAKERKAGTGDDSKNRRGDRGIFAAAGGAKRERRGGRTEWKRIARVGTEVRDGGSGGLRDTEPGRACAGTGKRRETRPGGIGSGEKTGL
jgi:hypothetical protein